MVVKKKHHKDCPFYPDSLSEYYDKRYCLTTEELEALKAELQSELIAIKVNAITDKYIGDCSF